MPLLRTGQLRGRLRDLRPVRSACGAGEAVRKSDGNRGGKRRGHGDTESGESRVGVEARAWSHTAVCPTVGWVSACQDATLNFTCIITVYSSATASRQFRTCTQVTAARAASGEPSPACGGIEERYPGVGPPVVFERESSRRPAASPNSWGDVGVLIPTSVPPMGPLPLHPYARR